jgi:hypothetical protein
MIADRRRRFESCVLFMSLTPLLCAHSFGASAVVNSAVQVRAEMNRELAQILSIVPVKAKSDLTIERAPGSTQPLQVFTRDRKYSAYVLCVPLENKTDQKLCAHRVYYDDYTAAARIYEIRGEEELAEVTRSVDGLKWLNNFTLSYERWAGPHFGHRYIVDVRSKKQIAAYDLFG